MAGSSGGKPRSGRQPYFLTPADGSPLSFAALWERWDHGRRTARNLHHHHDDRLPRARRHPPSAAGHHRSQMVQPVARPACRHATGAARPRAGTLLRPLREASRQHQGQQRPQRRSERSCSHHWPRPSTQSSMIASRSTMSAPDNSRYGRALIGMPTCGPSSHDRFSTCP